MTDEGRPRCAIPNCVELAWSPLHICLSHAVDAHGHVVRMARAHQRPHLPTNASTTSVVYYLPIAPTTIKIGTTTDLPTRIRQLRSEMQYVLAVEPGGFETEKDRHRQFKAERIGRKEDFLVSDELQAHLDHLRENTYSDELIEMYRSFDSRRTAAQRTAIRTSQCSSNRRARLSVYRPIRRHRWASPRL